VEMFFPPREFPAPALEAALGALGVSCRRLPDEVGGAADAHASASPARPPGPQPRGPPPRGRRGAGQAPEPPAGRAQGRGGGRGSASGDEDGGGFAMKVAALVLSRFEEARPRDQACER